MRCFLLIGFVCFQLLGYTQQQPVQASTSGIEKQIASYLKVAQDSLLANLPLAVQAAQKALKLAQYQQLKPAEQKCYLTLARIHKAYGETDLVVRNYDRAIALNLPNSTRLHYEKLPFLEGISNKDKAIRDAKAIAGIARKRGDREDESNAYIVLGNIYRQAGDYEQSLGFLKKADQLVGQENVRQRAYVQGYIGDNYNQLNQNSQAEQYYRNSIKNGQQARDTALLVENFDRMNNLYKQQKRNSDLISLNSVDEGKATKVQAGDSVGSIVQGKENEYWVQEVRKQARLNLAEAYLDSDSAEAAIGILNEVRAKKKAIGSPPQDDLKQRGDVHKLLSQAYDQSGRYAKALEEYKAFVAVQDSLLHEKDLRIQATLNKNIALQALENQILFLEKDRELSTQTIALNASNLKQQQTIILAVVLLALVTLFSLIIVIRKNRARARAYHLLELKSMRTRMNPHFIFNSLNSVNHFIAQNDEKAANKYLSQFSKLMREVLDSSDKDFVALDKEIDLLKVYLALERQRFENKFSYTLHVDPEVGEDDEMIPPMLVQPFIENAIWHGLRYVDYPGTLAVRFLDKGDHLLVEVEDNGIGRKASQELKTRSQQQHKSSGIRLSRNRIDLSNKVYGDTISIRIIDKEAEPGTLVRITIRKQHGNQSGHH